MKKTVLILTVFLLTLSCNKPISSSDISKINGYWEIEKVVFPDGKDKTYSINQTYDFFEIKNNKGFRTKVSPQLDGTFLVNGDSETVVIKEKEGKFYIYYKTSFSNWKEELVSISDDELVILNAENKEYHYKKAAPINLLEDGKKTK